jgi:uncharacterized repeat protein (TIGR01451 family)
MMDDSPRMWLHEACRPFRTRAGRGSKRPAPRFRPRLESLEDRTTPAVVNLTPSADDTLYQASSASPSQQLSNGAGQHFYVGETAQGANALRRGAIKFDLSAIPAGSTITGATLTLNMSLTVAGAQSVSLHRALMNWGEGTSNAGAGGQGQGEGDGVGATTGDVTWFYSSFATQTWTTPGGDFVAAASASTSVGNVGSYQWTGAGLAADVQQWVNNGATNFGWILTGNESAARTAKQFDTRESANRPVLTINYVPPVPDLTVSKSHTGTFRQGDAADTYTITVNNVGSGATTAPVTVTDTLPAGLVPTSADSGTVNGWTVTTIGQTVTATRGGGLAGGASYPALTLTVGVSPTAPTSVTNTVTVAGGGETNTANDSASDVTAITQLPDLTITKTHANDFRQGDAADAYTITVSNAGSTSTDGTVVTVTDTLPDGLSPTAADNGTINGWTVTTTGRTITATRSDALAAGSDYPALALTVAVSPIAPASVTNTAVVSGGGEANTANDSAADTTAITQVADLAVSKTHSGTFRPGDAADTYSVTVSNVGAAPTDGSAVTVTDTLPAGLAPTPADTGVVNGWTLFTAGQTVTATRTGVLDAGASYPPLTITVGVADDVAPVITNTATVSGGGEVNTANDSASDVTATSPVADLTIGKAHAGDFRQGDAADIYSITVSNVGTAPTTGSVTVTDTLPAGLTPTPADGGTINGWSVTVNGQTITATRPDPLADGASYPVLTLVVGVSVTAPASVTNTAVVSGGGEVKDANDTAADVTAITQVGDLTITKTHSGAFHPGDAADAYTITVGNVGATATDGSKVTVTDTLPAGETPTAADKGTINGWAVTVNGQTIIATRTGVLAAGASYPALTLAVAVAKAPPASVINTAFVSGGGEVNRANDSATDVTAITRVADLKIAMSHRGSFNRGGTAAFVIAVGNVGQASTNAPVIVIATLPTGLTYAGPATVNGWAVSVTGRTVTASRSDVLAVGASYPPLALAVSIAGNAPVSFASTASVSGGGEINFGNDTVTDIATGLSPRRRGA